MGHISNYSEQTASEIDEEIQSIISTAYQKTEKILTDHIDELHRLAGVLYEKEKIDGVEFQQVMDGNLLPSGMAAQALGQEPQAALRRTAPSPKRAAAPPSKTKTDFKKTPRNQGKFCLPLVAVCKRADSLQGNQEGLWQRNRPMATRASPA